MAFRPDAWVDADDFGTDFVDGSGDGFGDWVPDESDEDYTDMPQFEASNWGDGNFEIIGAKKFDRRGEQYRSHYRLKNPEACEDLRIAVRNGSADGVEEVLNNEAIHVDEMLRNGVSALVNAADAAQPDIVSLLLLRGASTEPCEDTSAKKYTALIAACNSLSSNEEKLDQCIEALVNNGADVDKADGDHTSPLMHAARRGRANAVQILLEKGAEVDAATPQAWTALCFAAREGHATVVRELLAGGAKVDHYCAVGEMPEDIAFSNGHNELADYLAAVIAGRELPEDAEQVVDVKPHRSVLHDNMLDKSNKSCPLFEDGITGFLGNLKLYQLGQEVKAKGISLQELLLMDEADLEQIGVNHVGDRLKIVDAAAKTIVGMFAQPPNRDMLREHQIMKEQLTVKDAHSLLVLSTIQSGYTSSALQYLQRQVPGALGTEDSDEERLVDMLLDSAEETCAAAIDLEKDSVMLHECVVEMITGAQKKKAVYWAMTGLALGMGSAASIYLLHNRISLPSIFR